jgi:hypothetical protein
VLAALIKKLNKLCREPATQTIQLSNPAMLILLGEDLKKTKRLI